MAGNETNPFDDEWLDDVETDWPADSLEDDESERGIRSMARYEIECRHCRTELGKTNDPREAYDMAVEGSDEHGEGVTVTARGLVNRVMFNRANRDR